MAAAKPTVSSVINGSGRPPVSRNPPMLTSSPRPMTAKSATKAAISVSVRRRFPSCCSWKVARSVSPQAQIDLGHRLVRLGRGEQLRRLEGEEAGDEITGEALLARVVVGDGVVVVLPRETDLVLRRRQLLLQAQDVLVGLELRVVLHQGEEAPHGAAEGVLGGDGLAGGTRRGGPLLGAD